MHRLKRAFGAAVAVAVIASGGGVAAATTAQAAAPRPTQEQRILLDLLGVDVPPSLSGIGAVDSPLSIVDPVWNLLGVVNSYQWMSNGIPIVGATGSSYTPTASDAGSQITALVTGSLVGALPVSVLTDALDIPLPPGGGGGGGGGGETPDPFTLLELPTLTGVPAVGEVIGLTSIQWSQPDVTTAVQWLSNGVPIPGATGASFIPGPDLAGTDLSALVTGTLVGLPVVSVITSALGIAPAEPDAITATQAPAASGTGKIGTQLTGTAPTWSTTGVTTTYQWLRNNVAIPGATQRDYTLVGEDLGKQVALKATGTKSAATGTASSAPVLGRLGDAPTASTGPSLSGRAAPGNLLTVQPGTWAGTPTPTFGYQWYVNGAPISGATASTYVVRAIEAGRNLAVLVTATRVGYAPGIAPTAALSVAKVASRTKLALPRKKVAQGRAGLLKITLAATGLKVSGKVTVLDGKKKLRTYTVRSADNGTRTVTLPRLKPGKHALTAVFGGSVATNPSRSARVVLTVLRRRT